MLLIWASSKAGPTLLSVAFSLVFRLQPGEAWIPWPSEGRPDRRPAALRQQWRLFCPLRHTNLHGHTGLGIRTGRHDRYATGRWMKTVEWLVAFFNRRTATVADRRSKRSESPVVLGFDPTNPEVVKWAATSSMAHVPGINDNTGAALREVLARGFREGNRPANIAREIGGLIGLAPEQERELDGYRRAQAQELTSKHPRRSAATLEGLVEKRVSRYRQRLLRDRALALVRSETIRASSARQTSHWERANELGYLGEATTRA